MTPKPLLARLREIGPLLFALLATIAAYWIGLRGGMLLDDDVNLDALVRYHAGELTWQGVVFGNASGMLGRSMSMLTFLANSITTGDDLWPFKATNLAIHLACGIVAFALLRRVLRLDPEFRERATLVAASLAAFWLALPIQVSTVLYLVQRMTQLSTLFTLLALLAFVAGRERLANQRDGAAALLFLAVPLLAVLATLSKENGILVPAFALVIELAWFRFGARGSRERRVAGSWFVAFLALPACAAVALLAARWDALVMASYPIRDFTLAERLLTEPTILWDYVRLILLPQGPRMGLIHDNAPLAHGLFDPPTAALAIAGWLAMAALAVVAWRRGHALVFAGIAWFFVGHALESTIFPLELYFEHRNYLPSLGVLMALAGVLGILVRNRGGTPHPLAAAMPLILGAVLLVYFVGTWARAGIWSNSMLVYRQALIAHPDSPRLLQIFATLRALDPDATDLQDFLAPLRKVRPDDSTPDMIELLGYCRRNVAPPPAAFERARDRDGRITNPEVGALSALAPRIEAGACPTMPVAEVSNLAADWIEKNRLSPTYVNSWKSWYWHARLLARSGQLDAAERAATKAWKDSGDQASVGVFVFQLNATLGRIDRCSEVLARLREVDRRRDRTVTAAIDSFDAWLREKRASSAR